MIGGVIVNWIGNKLLKDGRESHEK
jgi:hypothetical protein